MKWNPKTKTPRRKGWYITMRSDDGYVSSSAGGDLSVDRAVVEADLLERDLHGGLDRVGGIDGVVQIHGLSDH